MGELLLLAANKSDSEHGARVILGLIGFVVLAWIVALMFSKGPKD